MAATNGPSTDAWGLHLVDPQFVPLQGKLILLARDADSVLDRIYYNVFQTTPSSGTDFADWSGWYRYSFPEAPQPAVANVRFEQEQPKPELRLAGMDLLTVDSTATVVKPAKSAFQALGDDNFLYIFRAGAPGSLYLTRLRLIENEVAGSDSPQGASEQRIDYQLEPPWEVRFRRSGRKDLPAGPTDTQGYTDLDGRPFLEPTLELPGIGADPPTRFAVARVPSADPELTHWYIAVVDGDAIRIHRIDQTTGALTDFVEAPKQYTPIQPFLVPNSTKLSLSGFGPGLTFYAEQETAGAPNNREVELQRSGRLMLTIPVKGEKGSGLDAAVAVYDFGLSADGSISDLPPTLQYSPLIDGRLEGGKFVALEAPAYPTPQQRPDTVRIVDGRLVSAMVLGQVQPHSDLRSISGADGLIHLYYGGPPPTEKEVESVWSGLEPGVPQMMVAQFDARSSRAKVDLAWRTEGLEAMQSGRLELVALQTGLTMSPLGVTVSKSPAGENLRSVEIVYPPTAELPNELWRNVSAQLSAFAAALDGNASDDTSDPDVLQGTKVFFDFSGKRPLVSVPLAGSDAAASPSCLFISERDDFALGEVKVEQNGGTSNVSLTFRQGDAATARIAWTKVPNEARGYPDIFAGIAGSQLYAYPDEASNTSLFALATDSRFDSVPVLIFPSPGAPNRREMTVKVTVTGPERCAVTFTGAEPNPVEIPDLPTGVKEFVDALRASEGFKALRLGVSIGTASGSVVTSGETGPMPLARTAVLFSIVMPTPDATGTLQLGDYKSLVQGHELRQPVPPPGGLVRIFDPTRSAGLTVFLPDLPQEGETGFVDETPQRGLQTRATRLLSRGDLPYETQPPQSGAWIRRPTAWALSFDPSSNMNVPPGVGEANLAPHTDWTIEAWIRPQTSALQRVVSFVGDETTTDTSGSAALSRYFLDLKGRETLEFGSYNAGPNSLSTYFQTGPSGNASFEPASQFTWEFWVQPTAENPVLGSKGLGGILQVSDQELDQEPVFQIGLDEKRRVVLRYSPDGVSSKDLVAKSGVAFTEEGEPAWSHVAVVGEKTKQNNEWKITIFVNARKVAEQSGAEFYKETGSTPVLAIGSDVYGGASALVRLAEVRYWSIARTPAELRRTWFMSLVGDEPGLLGCWPVAQSEEKGPTPELLKNTAHLTGREWNAHLIRRHQPTSWPRDDIFLSMVGSVAGSEPEEANALLATHRWNHIAMSYRAGGGVDLNPQKSFAAGRLDSVSCGASGTLNPEREFAIDMWIQVPQPHPVTETLLSRWGTAKEAQSYEFSVGSDGRLRARIQVQKNKEGDYEQIGQSITDGPFVADNKPYHVAMTYRTFTKSSQDPQAPPIANWELMLHRYDPSTNKIESSKLPNDASIPGIPFAMVRTTDTPVYIGRSEAAPPNSAPQAIESLRFFHGIVGRTRFWNTVPALDDLFPEHMKAQSNPGRAGGLISDWQFREQSGRVATDPISSNDAKLSSTALWTVFKQNSQIEFFANGAPATGRKRNNDDLGPSKRQFRLGSPLDGEKVPGLTGEIDEVRIWDVARTMTELREDANNMLDGNEEHLVAYWNFSERKAKDMTGGLNQADPQPDEGRFAQSTAPVSNEGPQVRNVYGGLPTEFHQSVPGRPAMGEYSSLRTGPLGGQTAALLRQYVLDPTQSLAPPIKIGELELIYLGQQQTDPSLIGYIEGAPPLPSENLTRPLDEKTASAGYRDASSVSLTQTASVKLSFSNKSRSASDFSTVANAGFFIRGKINTSVLVASWENFFSEFTASLATSHVLKYGQDLTDGYTAAWTNRQTDKFSVQGNLEPENSILNPQVGRRWVPNNIGYALVESMTADRYVAILRSTKTMVATLLVPNLDIPPDRNIITFPIRADYTNNGTLDGKVGLANDPQIPNPDLARGSYFRPTEAYAWRQQVEQSTLRLQAFYDQMDVVKRGSGGDVNLKDVPKQLPVDFDAEPADVGQLATAKQGLVNSYVWTASGGLHTEAQQYAATTTHSYSGFRTYNWLLGLKSTLKVPFFTYNLDLMGGHSIDVSVTRSDELSQGFGLEVTVGGENDLRRWNGEHFDPDPAPGKVRAYRFMSIYLPPTTANARDFDNIVDIKWKQTSQDPFAVALRSMRTPNAVWRVLHRVTYVDRVPPKFATRPLMSGTDEKRKPINLEGNRQLTALIEACRKPGLPTPVKIGDAIAVAMNPRPTQPGIYPKSRLGELVPWWKTF